MKNILKYFKFRLLPSKICKTLEVFCFVTGLLSIIVSLSFIAFFGSGSDLVNAQNQRLALFVGLWAPTLIAISCYLKKS